MTRQGWTSLRDPVLAAFLEDMAKRFGDGKPVPVGPNGMIRACCRCEFYRKDFERHDPTWTPALCESWVFGGRRYWSATCRACGEIEGGERKARGAQATQRVEVAEKRPQIGMPRPVPLRPSLVPDEWRGGFER